MDGELGSGVGGKGYCGGVSDRGVEEDVGDAG